jgi:hypothetical protein
MPEMTDLSASESASEVKTGLNSGENLVIIGLRTGFAARLV